MKILFILPEYYPHSGGGISTYYKHYINAIKPYCKKIHVIIGSGYTQSNDTFNNNGITVEYLTPSFYNKYLNKFNKYDLLPEFKNNLVASWAMWQQAAEGYDFDIIECTDFGLGFIPWVIHHKKPIITRLHGSSGQISFYENSDSLLQDMYRNAELNLLPLCDSLITHSKANQAFWSNIFPLKKIDQFYPIYTSDELTLPYARRENFGLVTARIQKWKGPIQLCEAIAAINAPLIKWFGRDMPINDQQSTGEYLKINYPNIWGEKIIPHSPLPNDDIKPLQQKAKFGIVSSTWDMFNFSALEFLAWGTPIICSTGAGVSELIEHGKNGFTYIADDVSALSMCIQAINNLDEPNYSRIASAGVKTLKTKLSPITLTPIYLKHYELVKNNFNIIQSNKFLHEIYSPSDAANYFGVILDKQPLKKFLNYLYKRLLLKLTNN